MRTLIAAWAKGGSVCRTFEYRGEAEAYLRNLGYMNSWMYSCDGSVEYWVSVETLPSEWVDVIGDGSNPPAALREVSA